MKEEVARFVRTSKASDPIQSFKPNAAMREQIKLDLIRAGFVVDANGKLDLTATLAARTKNGA